MRILVTGITGFIGGHFWEEFSQSFDLVGVARQDQKVTKNPKIIPADLQKRDFTKDFPDRMDVVLHLAQAPISFPYHANEMLAVNTSATQELADYAIKAGVQHFVYASTGNVYKYSTAPRRENDPLEANSFYELSKIAAENILKLYEEFFHVSVLRLFTPYGPNQTGRMIPKLIDLVKSGQPILLKNGGQPKITPIYISDVVEVIRKVLFRNETFTTNVTGPSAVTVKEIATIAGQVLGVQPIFKDEEDPENWNLIGDASKMREIFEATSLVMPEQGIEWTITARH